MSTLEPRERDAKEPIRDVPKSKSGSTKPLACSHSLSREAFMITEPFSKPVAKKSPPPKKSAVAKSVAVMEKAQARPSKGATGTKKGRPLKAKSSGMMSMINNQSATMTVFSKPTKQMTGKQSVLVRATARAKVEKAKLAPKTRRPDEERGHTADGGKDKQVFKLMEIPQDVRARIWRYAVVYPTCFVWPESETGREQPDLAMVSRQIRAEVLPIYYAENIFAVDVSAEKPQENLTNYFGARKNGTNTMVRRLEGIATVNKWASAIEKPGWFAMIQKWSFSYQSESVTQMPRCRVEEDEDFMVYLKLIKREYGVWSVNGGVEVHREALCVLPGHQDFGRCIVGATPRWLNDAVIAVLDAAKGRNIRGQLVAQLAATIAKRAGELIEARCGRLVSSTGG